MPSVTLATGIDGINYQTSLCNCVPPDTIAAVGPNNVVEMANSAINTYSKTGTLLSHQSFAQFFAPIWPSGDNSQLFDPTVTYDDIANRWIVGADQQSSSSRTSSYLFAVSNTSDPTQGFTEMHQINLLEGSRRSSQTWGDFPHIGYNYDTYTITTNQFTFSSGQFKNIQVVAISKPSVLDANASTFTSNHFDIAYNSVNFTLHAAIQHGSVTGAPVWAVEENGLGNGSSIRIDKITNIMSKSPTITSYNITVPSYASPPSATSEGGVSMSTNDSRILSAALSGGRLIAAQNIGLNGVATGRIYDFNVSGSAPTLSQTINIVGPNGAATYYPAADINSAGTIGFSYMESSPTEYVSTYVGGQVAGSSAGSYQSTVAQAGQAKYTAFDSSPHRAGDYGGIGVDPTDGSFWGSNEYATSATSDNWGTHIRNFTVSGTTGPIVGAPTSGGTSGGGNGKSGGPIFEKDPPLLIQGMSDQAAPAKPHTAGTRLHSQASVDLVFEMLGNELVANGLDNLLFHAGRHRATHG